MLVQTGWWPANVDFDEFDLATVISVMNENNRLQERANRVR